MRKNRFVVYGPALALSLIVAAAAAQPARAGFTITINPGSPTATASGSEWSYMAGIAPGEDRLESGDYFILYDFGGFNGVLDTPDDWDFAAELTSTPPPGVTPLLGDDPTITNVRFIYTGATTTAPDFSPFVLASTLGLESQILKNFAFENTKVSLDPLVDGTKVRGFGDIGVPGVAAVPEPGTISAALIGLLTLAGLLRRRGLGVV
jgi:uncharacterized protein (TIGR03382 family)